MKKLLPLLLFLFPLSPLFAHSLLKGRVFDVATAQPLQGAVVQLLPGKASTLTDEHGHFTFRNLGGGTYQLRVTYLAYLQREVEVTLEDDQPFDLAIGLASKQISLDEVLISPAKELSVNSVSGLDLKLRPVNNTQDLLRLVPGLFIAQHAGGGKAEQIFLRGFDVDHGTDVAVSVDGMPVNMVSHAHGQGYADLHFVIPELVSNLNFSKGSYDAKTGDFNTAGAVRFQTANFLPRNFVKLEGGRFGWLRGVTGINLLPATDSANSKQNAYVAAEFVNSDGYFENSQNFRRINVLGKYNLQLSPGSVLNASLSHFTSRWDASGQIPERAVASGLISRFGAIDPTEGGNTSRDNVNIILSKTLPNGAVFRNQVFYSRYTFNLYSNFTFLANDSINGDQINQFETRDIYGYNGSYTQTDQLGSVALTSTAGINLRDDDVTPSGLIQTRRRQFIQNYKLGQTFQTNAAAFVEETLNITPRLSLSLGGRFDVFRFRYNSALTDTPGIALVKGIFSPKFNAYYALTPSAQVYVSAGTGFHSNDARVATVARNQRTLPRSTSTDLGLNLKLGQRVFINAAVWAMDLENEFVYVGDAGIIEVSGYSRRIGADLAARIQLTNTLFADLDLNITRPRATTGPTEERYIPLAPTATSIAGISYKGTNGFSGSLRYRYLDQRPANESNTLVAKGYLLADAVLSYTKGPYSFTASAENLFNVAWNEAQFATESRLAGEAEPVDEIHYTPGTPFFIKGTLGYTF
jgi:hypothetical protein